MADAAAELNERFAPHNATLPEDVLAELQSMLRLHNIPPSELFFKWESYAIKMGSDSVTLDLKTVRDFKKDVHEALERETRSRQAKANERRHVGATPRNSRATGGDMFSGMIDGLSPATPRVPMSGVNGNSVKRKSNFDTPASKTPKPHAGSSPHGPKDTPMSFNAAFAERQNAGQIVETLNEHIAPAEQVDTPFEVARIKLKANTDLQKFAYKPMAMKLSGASEILDDRIDSFLEVVQEHYDLDDSAFGNPANQSSNDIIAVGRIASDTGDGKLNPSSIVLETSRRMGSGLRVPLNLDAVSSYDLFPGKIVALKGRNGSGEYFSVSEIMEMPLLPFSLASPEEMSAISNRLAGGLQHDDAVRPLNILISSGPYTSDTNLDFEPLHALCEKAQATSADALIMLGPFLDIEHPLLSSGQLPPLPAAAKVNPDTATLNDVFRALISIPLQRLAGSLKNITILMVPSVRDAVQKHIAWPQDRLKRAELALPKQVAIVTNPVMISLNETVFGISSQDVLSSLRADGCVGGPAKTGLLERLSRSVIEQRHFYPIFPPTSRELFPKPSASAVDDADVKSTGAMLDIPYLALGEWSTRPDVLITPSALAPFAKVVESVVCINPGTLAKKRGAGTFAQMTVCPRNVDEAEMASDGVEKRVYERARVDVVRI